MLRGIHAAAKSQWIGQVNGIWPDLLQEPLVNNIRSRLESIARTIRGIGQATVEETLVQILEEQGKLKRGF